MIPNSLNSFNAQKIIMVRKISAMNRKSYSLGEPKRQEGTQIQQCTKMKFSISASSVNVTKSAGNIGFGHIFRGDT